MNGQKDRQTDRQTDSKSVIIFYFLQLMIASALTCYSLPRSLSLPTSFQPLFKAYAKLLIE